jgi:serine/threonine protein phosphatase PrpC
MRTHRFISRSRVRTDLFASYLLSLFGGLLFALLLPSLAFASPVVGGFTFGSSQGMDRAGVSVVRLVVSYGFSSSTSPQTSCSLTGLGAIVGSWASSNSSTSTYTDWVLTDNTLVNPNSPGITCAGSNSPQSLHTIAIYANNAYTNHLSTFPLASLQCQGLVCGNNSANIQPIICQSSSANACLAGTLLLPFTTRTPLPFIDMASSAQTEASQASATSTSQPLFGIGMTTNTSTSSPVPSPTSAFSTPTPLPTSVLATPSASQALQFLTPFQVLPSTTGAIQGESGMPIVNSNGQLENINTSNTDLGTDILTFVTDRLTPLQNGHTNPLHDAWNQGINDFYGGRQSSVKKDFQPVLALNPQFQAPKAFLQQTGLLTGGSPGSGNLQKSSATATPNNGKMSIAGIPLSSLSLTWIALGALIVVVLVLLLVTLAFLRRQARIRRERHDEIRRAIRRADADAPVIAAQEKAELQSVPEPSWAAPSDAPIAKPPAQIVSVQASPDLPCPNCGFPVRSTDNFCSNCRAPLSFSDSGLHVRLAGLPPVSPPAQMSPVMSDSSPSIADMPTVEMSPAAFRNGQVHEIQEAADSEKTLPFMLEHRTGRNLRLVVGTRSDPGIKRKHRPNEDSLFAGLGMHSQDQQLQQFGLFVVADGMGGHANGQDASRLSIQTIEDRLVPQLVSNNEFHDDEFLRLLLDGVQSANQAVHQRNMEQRADMGTTMTAALVVGTKAYIANVGDSRTYLYREGEGLQKITTDHSVVASLVEAKIINADDIYTHPKRNQIYRSLGEKSSVEVDGFTVQLQPGDKLLLCSDGLWDMTRDPIIQHILKTIPDPVQSRNALIQAAIDGGGDDNISVIVVQVTEDSQQTGINGFHVLAEPEAPQWPRM